MVAECKFASASHLATLPSFRINQTKPLFMPPLHAPNLSIHAAQPLGDAMRERDVIHGETINIESFVIESWLGHRGPFEYEYGMNGRVAGSTAARRGIYWRPDLDGGRCAHGP